MSAPANPGIVIEVALRDGGTGFYRLPPGLWAPLRIAVQHDTYALQAADPARRFPFYRLGGAPVAIDHRWQLKPDAVEAA